MHIQRFAWLKSSNSFTNYTTTSRTRNLGTHQSSSDSFLLPSTMTNAIEYQLSRDILLQEVRFCTCAIHK